MGAVKREAVHRLRIARRQIFQPPIQVVIFLVGLDVVRNSYGGMVDQGPGDAALNGHAAQQHDRQVLLRAVEPVVKMAEHIVCLAEAGRAGGQHPLGKHGPVVVFFFISHNRGPGIGRQPVVAAFIRHQVAIPVGELAPFHGVQNAGDGFPEGRFLRVAQGVAHAAQHAPLVGGHQHIHPDPVGILGVHPLGLLQGILQILDIPLENLPEHPAGQPDVLQRDFPGKGHRFPVRRIGGGCLIPRHTAGFLIRPPVDNRHQTAVVPDLAAVDRYTAAQRLRLQHVKARSG